jgi:hypothetical protein
MALGDYDAAIAHFETAISDKGVGAWKPERAWACSECAEALLLRGSKADMRRAATHLAEAMGIAQALGMLSLRARVLRLQKKR